MTIHPEFWPLVRLSTTFATTPSPRMTSSMVPRSSAKKGDMRRRRYLRGGGLSTPYRYFALTALVPSSTMEHATHTRSGEFVCIRSRRSLRCRHECGAGLQRRRFSCVGDRGDGLGSL